jgi:6-pyruvoyltetrahydropterin/6-carboxytetrahydropterin synthase
MISIFATFSFEAAHRLPHVPEGHKCGRLHGHNWTVELHVDGEVNAQGWIIDYYEIERAWLAVYEALDHRLLNDISGLENPTTEVIVQWIAERMRAVNPCKIVVRETPSFGAVWVRS